MYIYLEEIGCDGWWVSADFFRVENNHWEKPYFKVVQIYPYISLELPQVLANVDNFTNIPYISNPRGIPDDICIETKNEYNRIHDPDYVLGTHNTHSHSYVTLRELVEWRKSNDKITVRGFLNKEDSYHLDQGLTPTYWCDDYDDIYCEEREWITSPTSVDKLISVIYDRIKTNHLIFSRNRYEDFYDRVRLIVWFEKK